MHRSPKYFDVVLRYIVDGKWILGADVMADDAQLREVALADAWLGRGLGLQACMEQ